MTYFDSHALLALAVCTIAAFSTVIGSVFVLGANRSNPRMLAFGLAFAGGAMVYISLVELFAKAHKSLSAIYPDSQAYMWATLAFFAGVFFLTLIDRLIPNPHASLRFDMRDEDEHTHRHIARVGLLAALAITAHNFPEGMATFFATLQDPVVGAPLAVAIAIHNIPEGVSIAIPVYYATGSKKMAVLASAGSGLAEPVGAVIGYVALAPFLSPFVYAITFAMIAGAMVFLALDELLPTAKRYSSGHETTYGIVLGMAALALSLVLLR